MIPAQKNHETDRHYTLIQTRKVYKNKQNNRIDNMLLHYLLQINQLKSSYVTVMNKKTGIRIQIIAIM